MSSNFVLYALKKLMCIIWVLVDMFCAKLVFVRASLTKANVRFVEEAWDIPIFQKYQCILYIKKIKKKKKKSKTN